MRIVLEVGQVVGGAILAAALEWLRLERDKLRRRNGVKRTRAGDEVPDRRRPRGVGSRP